jgi:thiol-disulfide isomerase/thioredoxin
MWKSIVALALLVLLGAGIWQLTTSTTPVGVGAGKSSALLQDVEGKNLPTLAKGHKVTLINLWASWCDPCKAEFPALLKYRKAHADRDLNLVFVSVDNPSERPDAEKFLASQHVDFVSYIALGRAEEWAPAIDPRWQGAVPSTFVFDASGKLVEFWQGETNLDELETKITPHLM